MSVLGPYERAQQKKNLPMAYGMDAIGQLYGGDTNTLFVSARNFGMNVVDFVQPVKVCSETSYLTISRNSLSNKR